MAMDDQLRPERSALGASCVDCALDAASIEARALAQVEQRLVVQHEISWALARASNVRDAVRGVLAAVRDGLGLSAGALWLPEPSGRTIRCFEAVGVDTPELGPFLEATRQLAFEPGIGLPGRVWRTGRPAWIRELAGDVNFPRLRVAMQAGLRTGVAVPLLGGPLCLGVVEWFCREPSPSAPEVVPAIESLGTQIFELGPTRRGRAGERLRVEHPATRCFSVDDFAFLLGVANVLAASVQRAHLEDSLQATTANLEATHRRNHANTAFLAELSEAFAPVVSAVDVARVAGEKITGHFGATRVNFSDVSPSADEITVFFSQRDEGLKNDRITHRLSDYLAPELVAELQAGRTVAIDDVRFDPRTAAQADAYIQWDIGSMMLAPYVSDGRWKFVIVVHKPTPYGWRRDEVDVLHEVSARVHLRIERARTDEALREADRRKDEFLAMLGHELRNPLTPIRNAAHLLRYVTPPTPRVDAAREMIERQVTHLVRLVDDLLDVSRVSRGKITLQRELVDLAAIVAHAIDTVRPSIDARNHTLTLTLPPGPLRVHGDFTRLAQVVGNILNNSAKYTDEGGRISIIVERRARDLAVIRVIDDGRGMDPAAAASVFDLFFQVDRNLDRSEGGLGIGLSLVKNLVELHGGRVKAFSAGRGLGTELVVELPCLPDDDR
jgi:signal transduction histidine kinase